MLVWTRELEHELYRTRWNVIWYSTAKASWRQNHKHHARSNAQCVALAAATITAKPPDCRVSIAGRERTNTGCWHLDCCVHSRPNQAHVHKWRHKSNGGPRAWRFSALNRWPFNGRIKTAEQRTMTEQLFGDWYTGRWWVGCYIWYSEEGPGRAAVRPCPLSEMIAFLGSGGPKCLAFPSLSCSRLWRRCPRHPCPSHPGLLSLAVPPWVRRNEYQRKLGSKQAHRVMNWPVSVVSQC